MARPASLFHRNFQALLWVSFSLLAVLPILAIFRIWLLFYEAAGSTLATVEIGALIAFVAASLACGFVVLRSFGSTLRHLSETSAALDRLAPPALHAGAKPDEIRIQNELISLTQSLNRIHSEFSKNMEEARNQAQFLENLQNVMSHSSDMILILDSKNHITFSNRAAREKLGLLPDQNMRHALAEGLLGAEDGRRIAAILEAWTPVDEDLVCARATGGSLHIHCILTIVENDGGKNRSKIVVLRDFTERKRMERQLYRSEQLAALGQLISGVAHELNNPLSAVLGFSELCRDPRISKEELEHNLNILEREASRTACIVENLLNFSRQRTNRRGPADVHELLERCFSLLSYNFRTNSIAVQRRYAESIPVMELDEYQIQQVFMNLIINAVQAMRDARVIAPQITVATSVCNDGRELLIEIADNGPGIPPHLLPHIFDPFFTTKSDDQGTGLGLTVSQEIIRSHGGDVSV